MTITAEKKKQIIETTRRAPSDSGSPEIQVSLLTERISGLTGHLKGHKHDFASRRGLTLMVSKRNRLLKYLHRIDHDSYQKLIAKLGLRK
jgi:small subunit ribosomal protein S15